MSEDPQQPTRISAATRRFFRSTLRLRHLRTLALLAETGQVSKVARLFNVTQPAISKQIAEIEAALGADIVERQGNQIAFTAVGERLAAHARDVLRQIERARAEIEALRLGLSGRVVVGSVTSLTPTLLPPAIALFKQRAPAAVVAVTEGHANQLLPMLERGNLDLVVARVRAPILRDGIEQRMLLREPLAVVVGTRHPLLQHEVLEWRDAVAHPWIAPLPDSEARPALDALLAHFGLRLPADTVESTSLPLNLELLRRQSFVALLPLWLARRHASQGELAILPLDTHDLLSEARLYWRSEELDAAGALFRDCLEQASRQPPFAGRAVEAEANPLD